MNFDEWFAQTHQLAWETLQRDEISATASRDRKLYELERGVWDAAQAEQRKADAGIADREAKGTMSDEWESAASCIAGLIRTQGAQT